MIQQKLCSVEYFATSLAAAQVGAAELGYGGGSAVRKIRQLKGALSEAEGHHAVEGSAHTRQALQEATQQLASMLRTAAIRCV